MKRAAHLLLLAAASSAASLATPPRPPRPNRAAADALGAAVPSPQLDPALVAELSEAVTPPPGEAASDAALLDPVKFAFNTAIVDSVKGLIDLAYPDRPFARFYVLETVARVPYFAYLSVMHLRETWGERDGSLRERMRVHYAEADNELHHLLIMESLGGNSSAVDRAVAQGLATVYYWWVVFVFAHDERAAYHLSELVEDHAYRTYDAFLASHEVELRALPVPEVARRYYEQENPFLFDLLCTIGDGEEEEEVAEAAEAEAAAGRGKGRAKSSWIQWTLGKWAGGAEPLEPAAAAAEPECPRRPRLRSLYDVFVCVRNDEREHWGAMSSLVSTGTVRAAGAAGVSSTRPAAGTGLGAWLAPYLSRTTPLPPGPLDGGLRGRQ